MYNITQKTELQKLLLDKTFVAKHLDNPKGFKGDLPYSKEEIWKELTNPFFF